VLEDLRRDWPQLPVVMMSGHGSIETAVRATQLGAFDFIEKPLSFEKLLLTIATPWKRSGSPTRTARCARKCCTPAS